MIEVGAVAPDFEQDTANGSLRLHAWLGDWWGLLFCPPARAGHAFTPLCRTQLAAMARLRPAWKLRRVRVVGVSTGVAQGELRWAADVEVTHGCAIRFPVVADSDGLVAGLYGLAEAGAAAGYRVIIVDPARVVRRVLHYSLAAGCNFSDVLRAIDRLQREDLAAAEGAAAIEGAAAEGAAAEAGWTPEGGGVEEARLAGD